MKKRGQLTVFIIVGVVLVGSVLLFFLIRSGFVPNLLGGKPSSSANVFFNGCLEEEVRENVDSILKHGGYVESQDLSLDFSLNGEIIKATYLCYNTNSYGRCVNQEPVLFQNILKELKEGLTSSVEGCFNDMVKSFEKQGFEVPKPKYNGFEVSLDPNKIIIQTDSKIILTKSGESTTQENFKVIVFTRIYELINVVQEAINRETTSCDFNHIAYELAYPQFDIERTQNPDFTEVYQIKHTSSNEEFVFAVRGCIPEI